MDIIVWSDAYSISNEKIDHQHQKLVDTLNLLFSAMKEKRGNDVILTCLADVTNYTKYHFSAEEELFEKSDYPLKEKHKKEHRFFIQKIDSWQTNLSQGKSPLSVEMLEFLVSWVLNHIREVDKKMATYL